MWEKTHAIIEYVQISLSPKLSVESEISLFKHAFTVSLSPSLCLSLPSVTALLRASRYTGTLCGHVHDFPLSPALFG